MLLYFRFRFGQYVHYLSRNYPKAKITGLDIKQEQVDDCNQFFTKLGKQDLVASLHGNQGGTFTASILIASMPRVSSKLCCLSVHGNPPNIRERSVH